MDGSNDPKNTQNQIENPSNQNEQIVNAQVQSAPVVAEVTPANGAPVNQPNVSYASSENPNKEYVLTVLLSWFLGGWGIDRFYLGHTALGVVKLVTGGGLGIWSIIDLFLITWGKVTQKDNPAPLKGFAEHGKLMKILVIVIGLGGLLLVTGIITILALTTYSGVNHKAKDSLIQSNINQMAKYAESNYAEKGYYPTSSELDLLTTGQVNNLEISRSSYEPIPADCNNLTVKCDGYFISGRLYDGRIIKKESLNGIR